MKAINRRDFLKKTGKVALASGATFGLGTGLFGRGQVTKKLAYGEESQTGFNVYNPVNPNVKSIQSHTFQDSISQGLKPGITYTTSEPMVAVARGTVNEVAELEASRRWFKNLGDDPDGAKGFVVRVTHGTNFTSRYVHLKEPEVKFGQKIKRGERIGFPDERWNLPRLVLWAGEVEDVADPDNYGINHGFMGYWDGVTDLDKPNEEQNKRVETQKALLYKIAEFYSGPEKYTLLRKKHKGKDQLYKWAQIEKFRYLEYLYQKEPQSFGSLTKEQFEEMRKEFYSNQPIILTLPFKKG
ncbi:peptidoglycan DD-metalloendopeptidase family protein [bacterium]|nr:peptidoglycan DD-metalloendopeptidase family protein [bacterium]